MSLTTKKAVRADPQLRVIAIALALVALECVAMFALTGFPVGWMVAASVAAMSAAAVWFESYK